MMMMMRITPLLVELNKEGRGGRRVYHAIIETDERMIFYYYSLSPALSDGGLFYFSFFQP